MLGADGTAVGDSVLHSRLTSIRGHQGHGGGFSGQYHEEENVRGRNG